MVVLRLANAAYPDLRLSDLASGLADRVTAFGKAQGSTPRRSVVVAQLGADAQAFVQAANALDARADAAVQRGDTAAAAEAYAHFREAENAFFENDAKDWQRSLLYSVSGYSSGMLPTLDDTLSSSTGDAALKKLDTAFKAATNAASL